MTMLDEDEAMLDEDEGMLDEDEAILDKEHGEGGSIVPSKSSLRV